ncbi:MAG: hypothetical protein DRH37_11275, partial [Deltaproteobacteria bacterium]
QTEKDQRLVLNNVTAGSLTVTLDGDAATTVHVSGLGDVDISGGYAMPAIAAGDTVALKLNAKSRYLVGVIDVTGGDGIEAQLLNF